MSKETTPRARSQRPTTQNDRDSRDERDSACFSKKNPRPTETGTPGRAGRAIGETLERRPAARSQRPTTQNDRDSRDERDSACFSKKNPRPTETGTPGRAGRAGPDASHATPPSGPADGTAGRPGRDDLEPLDWARDDLERDLLRAMRDTPAADRWRITLILDSLASEPLSRITDPAGVVVGVMDRHLACRHLEALPDAELRLAAALFHNFLMLADGLLKERREAAAHV